MLQICLTYFAGIFGGNSLKDLAAIPPWVGDQIKKQSRNTAYFTNVIFRT